jgi:hypothetical protein
LANKLQVYDGTRRVGELEDHGRGQVVAFTVEEAKRRVKIGVFRTRTLAMQAIATATGTGRSP